MRGWLSIVGLVVVLGIVGVLLKKQLSAVRATPPALAVPGGAMPAAGLTGPLPSSVQPPSQPGPMQAPAQIQQQYKQALDAAMQQPRPMPDDVK